MGIIDWRGQVAAQRYSIVKRTREAEITNKQTNNRDNTIMEHTSFQQHAFIQAVQLLLNESEQMFLQSKTRFETEGIGCMYIEFPSVVKMSLCEDYKIGYLSKEKAQKRKYELLNQLIEKYNPETHFVLCIGCHNDNPNTNAAMLYKASVFPRNASEYLQKLKLQQEALLKEQQSHANTTSINKCAVCGKADNDMKRCARCHQVYYCGRDCQVKHWSVHKQSCNALNQSTQSLNMGFIK